MTQRIDKADVKAGARFERTVKGVRHTVEVVKVKGELRFRLDGADEFTSFGGAARAATGWAACNPLHNFYREGEEPVKVTAGKLKRTTPAKVRKARADGVNGFSERATARLTRKPKADKAAEKMAEQDANMPPEIAAVMGVEQVADIVFPGLNAAVEAQAESRRTTRPVSKGKGTARTGTAPAQVKPRQQRDSK